MQNFSHLIDKLFSQATFDPDRLVGHMYHPYIPLQVGGEPMRLSITQAQYHAFAKLVAAECAKLCESLTETSETPDLIRSDPNWLPEYGVQCNMQHYDCAELIRKQFGVTTNEE